MESEIIENLKIRNPFVDQKGCFEPLILRNHTKLVINQATYLQFLAPIFSPIGLRLQRHNLKVTPFSMFLQKNSSVNLL